MANLVTEATALVGDVLLNVGKLDKAIKIRLGSGGTAVGTSQTMTSLILPSQALVYDAFINVLAASTGATKTFSVGTSGTQAGFLTSISAATTGIVRPLITTATSGGATGGTLYVSSTFGSLLATFSSGSTAVGDGGVYVQKSYPSDSNASRTIGFTPGSSEWSTFSADLYLWIVDLTK